MEPRRQHLEMGKRNGHHHPVRCVDREATALPTASATPTHLRALARTQPGVSRDCRAWVLACLSCQRSKVTRHVTAPLGTYIAPTSRFRNVNLDTIGPLPTSNGFSYCLTAIDRFSRWPKVWPMTTITAEAVAEQFGVPANVNTDQGRQFESQLFNRIMNIGATKRIRTTSYPTA